MIAEVGRLEAMIDSAEKRDVEVTRLLDLQERDQAFATPCDCET